MRAMEASMLRVAFVGALASSFADRVRAHLIVPCEFVHTDEKHATDVLPDVDVVVTLVFTREMSAVAGRLRLIQVPGAGLDRIDRAAMPPGSSLATVHGHEAGIAEYVLGAMIALSRDFHRMDAGLRAGRWDSQWAPGVPPPPVWPELAGRTLGIRRDVRRSAEDDLALLADMGMLPEVLQRADYLVITLPLTPETRGLIGDAQLRLMKSTAIIVNVARAQVLDEDALYAALVERRIAGAALDVWYRYPVEPGPLLPARRPFHELPNVLMTPHVSGWTDGMLEARATLIAENIRRTACGEQPENVVPARPIGETPG